MQMITVSQAGQLAGVSRNAIYKAFARGELNKITIAGVVFVARGDVVQWMNRPRAKAAGRKPKPRPIPEPAGQPAPPLPNAPRVKDAQDSLLDTIRERRYALANQDPAGGS